MANQNSSVVLEPKFATLAMRDGSKWVYRIPDYLLGKVKVGAKVTVKYPTFDDDKFATVVDTLVSTRLRDDQLAVIVSVIDEAPYVDYLERRNQEKLLIQAAEQRKAEVERMAGFSAIAEGDSEMKAILAALGGGLVASDTDSEFPRFEPIWDYDTPEEYFAAQAAEVAE